MEFLSHKKPYRAGSHCGGREDVAYSDTAAGGESCEAGFFLICCAK